MRILHHEARAFRCLEQVALSPGPGLNLIRGENAQGKTSVLESILFLCTSKSHRTSNERELLREGSDSFHLKCNTQRADREVRLEANWWKGQKRYKINGVAQSRLSDILGHVNVVLFSPEDVELIKGGAGARRQFLDMELSQIEPRYLQSLQQYRLVLRQRNEVLRQSNPDRDLIAVWDVQLAQRGAALRALRDAFVRQLSEVATLRHAAIASGEELHLRYDPDIREDEDYEAVLRRTLPTDLKRQQTTRGIHRDDITIEVGGQAARSFGSQGQQKTATLAVRLAEVELVQQRTGDYPILMLDEVLAELDARRSKQLFLAVPPGVQCIATTTQLEGSPPGYEGDLMSFRMEGGKLEQHG
jgi:DNA replication and repair protein RecF